MYFFDCSNTFKIFKNFLFWVQFCISLIPLLDEESIYGFIQWTLYEWLLLSIKSSWCKCRWTCVWPFDPCWYCCLPMIQHRPFITEWVFVDTYEFMLSIFQWRNIVNWFKESIPSTCTKDWPCACPEPPPKPSWKFKIIKFT